VTAGRSAAGPLPQAVPRVAPAGGRPAGTDPDVPPGRLLSWLPSDAFPAERELLTAAAVDRRAPEWLTDGLRRLPPGQVFQNVEQLAAALHTQRQVRVADEPDVVRAPARP
jgi:hypothetical protein